MKRWLVFLCLVLTISSIILYCIYLFNIKKEENIQKKQEEEKQIIEYKANQTINVKMCKTGEIVAMDINDYLRGVLASEMPAAYDIEALKAQAVVARTYTYKKILENGEEGDADICDSYAHCQAFYNKEKIIQIWTGRGFDENLRKEYWGKINDAVVETQNVVVTYNGKYIKAFFHASSPVRTESVDQIWGKISYPYLVSVENKESEEYANRYSEVIVSFEDLKKYIVDNIDSKFKFKNTDDIYIRDYTTSNRVNTLYVNGTIISSEKLRTGFGLKSTLFEIEKLDNAIKFKVTGYGHGVGLSQVGSDYLAKSGMKYEDIIKYYYKDVDVVKIDN